MLVLPCSVQRTHRVGSDSSFLYSCSIVVFNFVDLVVVYSCDCSRLLVNESRVGLCLYLLHKFNFNLHLKTTTDLFSGQNVV